ncbi:MAG: hypothetical protein RLY31_2179 [Bacteroidota bacterium]
MCDDKDYVPAKERCRYGQQAYPRHLAGTRRPRSIAWAAMATGRENTQARSSQALPPVTAKPLTSMRTNGTAAQAVSAPTGEPSTRLAAKQIAARTPAAYQGGLASPLTHGIDHSPGALLAKRGGNSGVNQTVESPIRSRPSREAGIKIPLIKERKNTQSACYQ